MHRREHAGCSVACVLTSCELIPRRTNPSSMGVDLALPAQPDPLVSPLVVLHDEPANPGEHQLQFEGVYRLDEVEVDARVPATLHVGLPPVARDRHEEGLTHPRQLA